MKKASKKQEATNSAPPLTQEWSASKVRAHLEKDGIVFLERKVDGDVYFEGQIGSARIQPVGTFAFRIVVCAENDYVQCFFSLPTYVPEARRDAVAAYCGYVSGLIKAAKIYLDPADGAASVEFSVPVKVLMGNSDTELGRLIGVPFGMAANAVKGFYDVLNGKAPKEAYAETEANPV